MHLSGVTNFAQAFLSFNLIFDGQYTYIAGTACIVNDAIGQSYGYAVLGEVPGEYGE